MVSKYDAFAGEGRAYRDEELMEELYIKQRLSMQTIADKLNCGVATISRWIDRHGLEARSTGESNRIAASRKRAYFGTNNKGREVWLDATGEKTEMVQVHRLIAVSEYGFEAVCGSHVHHEIPIPWLNYADNLTPMDPSEHISTHAEGNSRQEKINPRLCEKIQEKVEGGADVEKISEEYSVHPRTIKRHSKGRCHHD